MKEEARVSFHKPTNHKLRHQLRIWRLWWIIYNEIWANSMKTSDSTSTSNWEDMWFIESCASYHMTSHQEWFHDLRTPNWSSYIEAWDDTTHPIQLIGNEDKNNCIKNVLQVPTITNNLFLVVQIMEQGMQVRFNNGGCFIENNGQHIAKGRK